MPRRCFEASRAGGAGVVASVAVFLDPLSLCFVMKISLYAGGITAVQRKSRPVAVFYSRVQPVQRRLQDPGSRERIAAFSTPCACHVGGKHC